MKLRPSAKLLYLDIVEICNKCGFCDETNGYFASKYSLTKETVSRLISSLKNKGLIRVDINKSEGNTRKIYLK